MNVDREELAVLEAQWKSISAAQLANFTKFRTRKNIIGAFPATFRAKSAPFNPLFRVCLEKDVQRTDRLQDIYSQDDSEMSRTLQDLLLSYSFYDFDIGYVQGMSDLLGPILSVVRDPVVAFWCFVSLMKRQVWATWIVVLC